MSIHRSEWSKQDADCRKVDVEMLNIRYFNTDDGYIWRVDDFILIQGPESTREVHGEGKFELSYQEGVAGRVLWNVILKRDGDANKARLGMLLSEFEVSPSYHKVKEPVEKKVTYRGGRGGVANLGQGHQDVEGVDWEADENGNRRPIY